MDRWIRIGRAFSPWAVALSVPRALPWAGIGARRWRLRPSAGYGFLGSVTTSAFSQTEPLPKAPFILQNWPGFQPLGCGSICTQGFALGWYRSAPLALEPSAGCGFLGSVTI